jgi:AraC-like DNA-binding protein
MAELISQKFHQSLSVDDIARHVNLHPGYAMTLFRQQTGVTLNTYLTRQRVAHAQRLLAMTALPILEVAAESGFHSVSRFYEAFKGESGCTPREFRKRLTLRN